MEFLADFSISPCRGKGQKVIAFSFYLTEDTARLNARSYFEGIKSNLNLMPKFYPGWIMRVYYNLDGRPEMLQELCQLACQNDQLDICDAGKLPGMPMEDARSVFPMIWRFFPTLDPQVTRKIVTVS